MLVNRKTNALVHASTLCSCFSAKSSWVSFSFVKRRNQNTKYTLISLRPWISAKWNSILIPGEFIETNTSCAYNIYNNIQKSSELVRSVLFNWWEMREENDMHDRCLCPRIYFVCLSIIYGIINRKSTELRWLHSSTEKSEENDMHDGFPSPRITSSFLQCSDLKTFMSINKIVNIMGRTGGLAG